MSRFVTSVILAGLIGVVGCESSPTRPTAVTEPQPPATGIRTSQTAADSHQVESLSLTARLAEIESTGHVSLQSEHEFDRVRALIAAITAQLSSGGDDESGDDEGSGDTSPPTLTITDTGASPKELPISIGQRVRIVNNSSRPHELQSDPHPFHTACPPMNRPGLLDPGASGMTDVFSQARTCGFHDHLNPTDSTLRGQIVIGGGGAGGGDNRESNTPYLRVGRS